ncbi:MAG: hypothetical protein ACYC1M_06560 [Armatimonadota bacterium]
MKSLPVMRITNPEAAFIPMAAKLPSQAYCEVPPWVVNTNLGPLFSFTTGYSYSQLARPDRNLLRDADTLYPETAFRSSAGVIFEQDTPPPALMNSIPYWRRNYYGVFSMHCLKHPRTGEMCHLAILHGENKNERVWPGVEYDNTILPPRKYKEDEYSGVPRKGGDYRDNWSSYFGFVGMAWCPRSEMNGWRFMSHDEGPVLWPSVGYLSADGKQAGCGLRHPSSIVHDGHLYVFYLESWPVKPAPGRQGGIKLARAPLDRLWTTGSFRNWFGGGCKEPSLPHGFSKLDRRCLSQPGGRSDKLFPENAVRFSVARVRDKQMFVGVEERQTESRFALYLRCSEDLTHWSDGVLVPGTERGWADGYHYPILMNREMTSCELIDPDGFLLATSTPPNPFFREVKLTWS